LTREYNEHNFGLIHHQQYNCAPKPGIVARSVFIRLTADAAFQDLHRAGDLYSARYRRPDGSDVLRVWTERGTQRIALSGQLEFTWDLMGRSLAAAQQIDASENPIYVVGHDLAVTK
jgi:hypothetical protein